MKVAAVGVGIGWAAIQKRLDPSEMGLVRFDLYSTHFYSPIPQAMPSMASITPYKSSSAQRSAYTQPVTP